ncbi:MAG: S49 family peptidase [Steroidobacteraceae bacterium]
MSAASDTPPPEGPDFNQGPNSERALSKLVEAVKCIVGSQEALAHLHERALRADRRWKNIRAVCLAVAFLATAISYSVGVQSLLAPSKMRAPYVALVRVQGVIDADQQASAEKVSAALSAAFEDIHARAVVVLINSPGGSPVQSALIHDRLIALRQRYPDKPVRVVGEDMLTSGAYYIAVAADRVCVNRSTMTGSIGVVMSGWGLDRAIGHFGIERRVFVAGENKARLDAFRPLSRGDQRKATGLLNAIHTQFIAAVKAGRGERLKGDPRVLWSGDYWTGEEALRLGLVDELCDVNSLIESEFHLQAVRDYTAPPGLWSALSRSFGVVADHAFSRTSSAFEPRLLP